MNSFLQDLRYGFRMLLKAPGLSAAAVLALALGIGANIVIFSFADGLYFRPLPVRDPDRLVALYTSCPAPGGGMDRRCGVSAPDVNDIRAQSKSLEDAAFFERRGAILMESGDPTRLLVNEVSDNWLEVMGVSAAAGRIFTAEEQRSATAPEAMISYTFWQRHYAGDPSIVGRVVTFTGRQWTIIGVLPRGFRGTEAMLDPELTVPISSWNRLFEFNDRRLNDREYRYYEGFARLRRGATVDTLNAELQTISARLQQAYPKSNQRRDFSALREKEARGGDMRKTLALLLLSIAALVLLISCANVANLLFARSEHRRREVATRLALGATRLRIARQFFLESVVFAGLSGVAALVIGKWTVDSLPALLSGMTVPISIDARLDTRVLLFAMAAAFVSVFIFGLAPALDASRTSVLGTLKQQSSAGGDMSRRRWLRDAMVVAQMCISLVLIVSTGLLLKTLFKMEAMDPGFSAHRPILIADVLTPDRPGLTPVQQLRTMQQSLAGLPGVQSVAFASRIPMGPSGGGHADEVLAPGHVQPDGRGIATKSAYVSDHYFETIGTQLVRGRTFDAGDDGASAAVAIVNQTMARKFWGTEDAVGRRFKVGARADGRQAGRDFEVIGVVQDGKYNDLTEAPVPYLFLNMSQFRDSGATVIVATSTDPASVAMPLRREMRDKFGMTVMNLVSMRDFMRFTMFTNRLAAQLVTVMAVLGMLLATIGLYGVIAYLVGRRTHEIGIRVALGASEAVILQLFLRRGLRMAVIGIAIGAAAALAFGQVMGSLLYNVSPRDPAIYIAAAAVLLVAALAATYFPARRAARVDPMIALRYE